MRISIITNRPIWPEMANYQITNNHLIIHHHASNSQRITERNGRINLLQIEFNKIGRKNLMKVSCDYRWAILEGIMRTPVNLRDLSHWLRFCLSEVTKGFGRLVGFLYIKQQPPAAVFSMILGFPPLETSSIIASS